MPKEDHGILIISVAAVVSFLTCLLCTLCHRKRKRRHHRQLHRNAHYDSTTSATGNAHPLRRVKISFKPTSLFRSQFKQTQSAKQFIGKCSWHQHGIIENSTGSPRSNNSSASTRLHQRRNYRRHERSHGLRR